MSGKKDLDFVDRYGKNFTIRFVTEERNKLDYYSNKLRMKPTTFIREALHFFYEKLDGDEEVKKVESTEFNKLALLINEMKTTYGRARLQQRFLEGS